MPQYVNQPSPRHAWGWRAPRCPLASLHSSGSSAHRVGVGEIVGDMVVVVGVGGIGVAAALVQVGGRRATVALGAKDGDAVQHDAEQGAVRAGIGGGVDAACGGRSEACLRRREAAQQDMLPCATPASSCWPGPRCLQCSALQLTVGGVGVVVVGTPVGRGMPLAGGRERPSYGCPAVRNVAGAGRRHARTNGWTAALKLPTRCSDRKSPSLRHKHPQTRHWRR